MGSLTPDALKDDPELEDSLNIHENLPVLLTQKRQQQCSLVSNSGKWLHLVKNCPRGSFSRATSFFDNKIPRHLVSLDEKYLRRCLELINISAFKPSASCSLSSYHFDSSMIPKENVARLLFDLPLVDDSGNVVISPVITGCKRVTHLLDSPEKAVSVSSTSSVSSSSSSSEQSSSCWSPSSSTVSQGTLQFTMKDNKIPHFVFSLDDQKEIYVATLSNASSVGFDRSSLDYSYLIHLKKGRVSSELVGKLKVSTLFSVSSANERTVERQFVLFSNGGNQQLQGHSEIKKHRGLSKKVVDALKRGSRQRSISRFSRTSSVTDFSSWEPFQEPDQVLESVSLLDSELPHNLEASAVVVREKFLNEEEKAGGWGMKFLKKTSLSRRTKQACGDSKQMSIDVVIPSGVHGGPRSRNGGGGGPSSLVERWKSGGSCDCSGWDLGCSLTVFKGQARKDQSEGQCNLFELFTEGSKQGIPGLRIMSVREGLYFVQFQAKMSVLQSFSTALAYVHSQSQRLRPWLSGKVCREKLN
ncbi:hypothetical protein Bca4012_029664 [Brassica carinata]|uniref:Uncharacterized protein n=1 Tax=Brassica carinata TaxID=52824 RepID=A0A8X7RJY5_BRACI|nr:hypothetical protein Bca52824_048891 [Brassica carinata]